MAINTAIPVSFEAYFPHGALAFGDIERGMKWTDGAGPVEDFDKLTGLPIHVIRVMDADPAVRKGQAEVTVKLASPVEPVLPPELPGTPFHPVVFEGLTVTPYVKEGQGRPRVAFSLRATAMHAPTQPKPRGGE